MTLLVAGNCLAGERPVGEVMTMRVDGEATIDTTGHVASYALEQQIEPALKGAVDKAVASWRFAQSSLNGKPVNVRTRMRLTLRAQPSGGNYLVQVENVIFGGAFPKQKSVSSSIGDLPETTTLPDVTAENHDAVVLGIARKGDPPRYPESGSANRLDADVLLALHVAPDGRVLDVVPLQSSLLNVKGPARDIARIRADFERAAVAAFRKGWLVSVQIPPGKTPTAKEMTGTISVRFAMPDKHGKVQDPDTLGKWRLENRSELRAAPWIPASDAPRLSISDFDPKDGMLQPSPAIRLLEGEGK